MKLTAKELSDRLGVDYVVVSSVLRFLVQKGYAAEVGSQKSPSGKGKPSIVYEVPESVTLNLGEKK